MKAQKDKYAYVLSNMQIPASNHKMMHIRGGMGKELEMGT